GSRIEPSPRHPDDDTDGEEREGENDLNDGAHGNLPLSRKSKLSRSAPRRARIERTRGITRGIVLERSECGSQPTRRLKILALKRPLAVQLLEARARDQP